MKIKVCGMRNPVNIEELVQLPLSFMGLIFYPKSTRYVEETLDFSTFPSTINKVGVFVNSDFNFIKDKAKKYALDYLQLHGNETPQFCKELQKKLNLPIIKAFRIETFLDFEQTKDYEKIADYFLFDTKTPQYGGSGKKFNWSVLENYKGVIPFFLSGGISIEDAEAIKSIKHPKLYGIDINSKFEITPALKDICLIKKFINLL